MVSIRFLISPVIIVLLCLGCCNQNTLKNSAILGAIWFVGSNAVVGKTLIPNTNLLFAKVVAKSFDRTKIVVLGFEFDFF